MTVIEVDLDPTPDHSPPRLPPAHRYRWAGLVLVVALLCALGGADPDPAVRWRPLGTVALDVRAPFTVNGDHLYTVQDNRVSAYRAGRDAMVHEWDADLTPRTDTGVRMAGGDFVGVSGDVVLVRPQDAVPVVLDRASGRVRWTPPGFIEVTMAGVAVTREMVFRPGTEYDQSSGDAGPLYVSTDGTPHTEPPQRTELRGFDVAGGRQLWTFTEPGSIVVAETAGGVLMVSSRRIALVDARTGAVRREHAVSGPASAEVAGAVAVIEQDGSLVGYDTATLAPRWRVPAGRTADPSGAELPAGMCLGLVCRVSGAGMDVLDEGTGVVRWAAPAEVTLRRVGSVVLEYDPVTQQPLRLLDASSGRLLTMLGEWQAFTTGSVLLSRWEPDGDRVFAAIRGGAVHPIGRGDPDMLDCRAGDVLVACRTGGSLKIYATS